MNSYYSFKIDNETGDLSIGVDSVLLTMKYIGKNDIDPMVSVVKNGHRVFYREIYN